MAALAAAAGICSALRPAVVPDGRNLSSLYPGARLMGGGLFGCYFLHDPDLPGGIAGDSAESCVDRTVEITLRIYDMLLSYMAFRR